MRGMAGKGLFAVGIMVAISCAAKVPAVNGEWPDSWPWFVLGAVVALVGVVRWRMDSTAQRKAEAESSETEASADPIQLLADLQEPVKRLGEELADMAPEQICIRVDELLETYLLPIAERRQLFVDRLGMSLGAEILVTLAFGERMMNRTWTAAGDGHSGEAVLVFPDAVSAFAEAQALVAGVR